MDEKQLGEMKKWMKFGSIGVCFWSLLLILVGVSQLTYGAYYISKLPVFKIGSPVWIGFLVRKKLIFFLFQ